MPIAQGAVRRFAIMLVILLTSALTLMFKLMCLVDLPAVGEPSPCVHRPTAYVRESRRRCGRVPAQMWARESRRRCGRVSPGADAGA